MSGAGIENIPAVKRARGYRLYDRQDRRYLDFYQDGGRAILGHRPGRLNLELKSALSRGLLAAYPSIYDSRLEKSFRQIFPPFSEYRIYASAERALTVASHHFGRTINWGDIYDPAIAPPAGVSQDPGPIWLWRPFLDLSDATPAIFVPVLPFPGLSSATVLLFRNEPNSAVPDSDVLSPVFVAGIKRGLYDLQNQINTLDRGIWSAFDQTALWQRVGPYLTLECDKDQFEMLFEHMLEIGMLLCPFFPGPSIIPAEYSPGEIQVLTAEVADGGKVWKLLS